MNAINYTDNHEQALNDFSALMGADGFYNSESILSSYSSTLGINSKTPIAVLKPKDLDQLQKILIIANQYKVALYTISQGKNWGYGSASPVQSNNIIVDLSGLNKIVEFNEELLYAVVEPGVTQQDLYNYIADKKLPIYIDTTGAAPGASVLGNVVERGFGLTPYGDRFQNYSGMEVMLANGDIVKTGFGRFDNCKTGNLYKTGLGPYVDGIFTQSNFGIVTKAAVWLMPKPKELRIFEVQFKNDENFIECIPILRDLKLRGVLTGVTHMPNDIRVMSTYQSYPFSEMNNIFPLSDEVRAMLRKRWGVAEWSCIGSLWGSKDKVRADLKEITEALKGKAKIRSASDRFLTFVSKFPRLVDKFGGIKLRTQIGIAGLLKGRPTKAPMRGIYWRKNKIPEELLSPEVNQVGLLWCSPVMPATSRDVRAFINITRKICKKFHFEMNATVSLLAERALCATVAISFDRADSDQLIKAKECHKALLSEYLSLGFAPYRAGSDLDDIKEVLFNEDSPYAKLCKKMKLALDPNNILSPGRYGL